MEPMKYYENNIKDKFSQTVAVFFDKLVEKSQIDIENNRVLVSEYEKILNKKNQIKNRLKLINIFSKFLTIIGTIIMFCGGMILVEKDIGSDSSGVVCLLAGFLILLYRWTGLKAKVEDDKKSLSEYDARCEEKLSECYASMAPLNALMDSKYTFDLINENIPFIKMDPYFNMKRFEEMYNRYGMEANEDENYSALEAVSGSILGNPFVLLKQLRHEIVNHTYTGTKTISWTEYYTDINGKRQKTTRYEVLAASVVKPMPVYSDFITLIFANDVAPDLIFFREPGHVEKLSDWAYKLKLKKDERKLRRREERSIRNGGSFITMSNSEFEAVFNALDRNNETQFRLLFTPLAQLNIIAELKNKEYGDNFYFFKDRKINRVIAEHTENWDVDCSADKFKSYSYDRCRDYFIRFNVDYFKNFFFTMLPLISIPLYQQYMAEDYIYETQPENNYNPYMAETLANAMDESCFVHPHTRTPAILKAVPVRHRGETDIVKIKAHSYDAVSRVTYVSVYGGDGRFHNVPVYWDKYIPLSKESFIEVKKLGIDDNDFEKIADSNRDNKIFKKRGQYVYKNKLFATVGNSGSSELLLNAFLRRLKK